MRQFSRWGAPLACLLGVPALGTGIVLDDYFLARQVRAADGIRWQGLWEAFALVSPTSLPRLRELGELPWWSEDGLTLRFLRPLSALTHALDFAYLTPFWMHVESLLWLALLNVAVAHWYRRLLGEQSGLAVALFALAPGHIFAASWLSNRNAVLGALFGVCALIAYDRREQRSAWAATALYALSLLCGEIGVCTLGLLVAYAVCLDERAQRYRALLPAFLVTLVWGVVHVSLGYGARRSELYVSPLDFEFLGALAQNVPLLLFGQWGLPGITFRLLFHRTAAWALVGVALLCLTLWTPRLRTLLRTDARARFGALGSLLAIIPVSATAVHDRLLIVADIAGLGLLALAAQNMKRWMAVRLGLGALLSLMFAASLQEHIALGKKPFETILREPSVPSETVVFVNSPLMYYAIQLPWIREYEGGPKPARLRSLAPGAAGLAIERIDEHSLRVHGDLFRPVGTGGPWFSRLYLAQLLTQFTRADWSFRGGEEIELSDMRVRVVEALDGYPKTLDVTFTQPLAHYRFLEWRKDHYEEWALPPLGQRVELAEQL